MAREPEERALSDRHLGDAQVLLHVADDVHDYLHLHHGARHQGHARCVGVRRRVHHLPQGLHTHTCMHDDTCMHVHTYACTHVSMFVRTFVTTYVRRATCGNDVVFNVSIHFDMICFVPTYVRVYTGVRRAASGNDVHGAVL